MKLDGSVVIVTGGASGLGAGACEVLREAGAKVAVFDVSSRASSTADRTYTVDVSDDESVVRGLDAVMTDLGPIRAVVNSAGVVKSHSLLGENGRFPTDLFTRTVSVNLTGTFIVMAHAAERMAENEPTEDGERGVVVNVASIAALDGSSSIAYAASKGGVVSMSLTAARDLASHGIRVNAIAPGYMDTEMFQGLDEAYRAELISGTVFPQRLGGPREFGDLAAHLITNSYLNAATIRFDAGARV